MHLIRQVIFGIKLFFANLFDFSAEVSKLQKMRNVVNFLILNMLWTVLMISFLVAFFGFQTVEIKNLLGSNFTLKAASKLFSNDIRATLFLACVLAPLWEEAVFRYVAITLGQALDYLLQKAWLLLPAVCLSSIIFGRAHGSSLNILFQGVGGFGLCWLYLKNKNSYWSVVSAHALWNLIVIGGTSFV